MSTSKARSFGSEIPGEVPIGYVTLQLRLIVAVDLEPEGEEDKYEGMSDLQKKVLMDIKGSNDDNEKFIVPKTERVITQARFHADLIEGYYGVTNYTVLLFNGDAYNVADKPNEIDKKIKECYERIKREEEQQY